MLPKVSPFWATVCASVVLAVAATRADGPDPRQREAARSLDPAKLPPGAVIVISDNPRDALRQVDAIVLSPVEYKKLLEAADKVRRAENQPELPSTCRISGRIEPRGERGVCVLTAAMKFRTTAARTTVAVGLQYAKPTAATLDGQLAVFAPTNADDGYSVVVESPGEHTLQVELETPLIVRPGEVYFELGLPGAPITVLERLDLPNGAGAVRLAGRSFAPADLASGSTVLLGPARRLDVRWNDDRTMATAASRVTAEARTDVHFADNVVVTRTRLTVRWTAGSPARFSVSAPANSRIELEPADAAAVVDQATRQGITQWTIRPADHVAECGIDVESRSPYSLGSAVAVCPARIVRAARQRGTIAVSGASNLRLVLDPSAEAGVVRRDAPETVTNETTFSYTALTASGELVRVTPQPLAGQIDAHFQHQLALTERGWRWQGKLEIRPVRAAVPFVDIEAPSELREFRSASPDVIESVVQRGDGAANRRVYRVQFVEPLRRATTLTLEGQYDLPESAREVDMALPRALGVIDRGGQLTASAPAGIEVRGFAREWTDDRAAERGRVLEPVARGAVSCSTVRSPARISLNWRAAERDAAVAATVYVQLGERQATIRHQFRLPTAAAAALRLSGPASLSGRIRGVQGSTLQPVVAGEWNVQPPASSASETIVTVAYSVPLSANARQQLEELPLVWLDNFKDVETDVFIWPGDLLTGTRWPVQSIGPWTEIAPAIVPDMAAVPAMALHGSGANLPLAVNLEDAIGASAPMMVDRLWIQALVEPAGRQNVRMRSLIRTLGARTLTLTLPRSASELQFQAMLDGKRLAFVPGGTGDETIRLRIEPDPARVSRVLEFTYGLKPSPTSAGRFMHRIETPLWESHVQLPIARWQIGYSDDQAAITFGPLDRAELWTWERGFWESQPRWSSNGLSRWFIGDARYGELDAAGISSSVTALGSSGQPVWILLVPRSMAWLACSLTVLTFGLALLVAGPRARTALALGAIGLIGCFAVIHGPFVATFAMFSQPGLAVWGLVIVCRTALDYWRRPGVFQTSRSWSGPETIPLAAARAGSVRISAGNDEPDLIPLKRS